MTSVMLERKWFSSTCSHIELSLVCCPLCLLHYTDAAAAAEIWVQYSSINVNRLQARRRWDGERMTARCSRSTQISLRRRCRRLLRNYLRRRKVSAMNYTGEFRTDRGRYSPHDPRSDISGYFAQTVEYIDASAQQFGLCCETQNAHKTLLSLVRRFINRPNGIKVRCQSWVVLKIKVYIFRLFSANDVIVL